MSVFPTGLKLQDGALLTIAWSDGTSRQYGVRELRDACPCATCREKRASGLEAMEASSSGLSSLAALPVLSPEEARPLKILDLQPVGSYAYGVHFSDGHNTGIFTLEHLRRLGEEVSDQAH